MTKKIVLFCLLTFTSIPIFAQQRISLEECYTNAQKNYPEIKRYDLIEKAKAYNISNASKSWLPQVNFNAKASYQSDVTTLPFDDLGKIIPNFEIPVISKDQYAVQVEVNQAIWDGGRTKAQKDIITNESNISKIEVKVALYAIREKINQIYFGILLQIETLEQNKLLDEELHNNLDMINGLIDNGVANISDRESLEVEILQLEQSRVNITSSLGAYRRMLSYMVGINIDEQTLFTEPQMVGYLEKSNISRPELRYFDAQQNLLSSKEQLLKKDYIPQFNLFVNSGYGRPALNMLDNSFKPYAIGGVRLSWNIGRLYTQKNSRNNINVKREAIEVERDKFLYNTELALISQNESIQKNKELMVGDRKIYNLRHSITMATKVKLENGTATTTDLINNTNAESRARSILNARHIELLLQIYNHLYLTNNEK